MVASLSTVTLQTSPDFMVALLGSGGDGAISFRACDPPRASCFAGDVVWLLTDDPTGHWDNLATL